MADDLEWDALIGGDGGEPSGSANGTTGTSSRRDRLRAERAAQGRRTQSDIPTAATRRARRSAERRGTEVPIGYGADEIHPEMRALFGTVSDQPGDADSALRPGHAGAEDIQHDHVDSDPASRSYSGAGSGRGGRGGGRDRRDRRRRRPPRDPRRRSVGALIAGIVIVVVVLAAAGGGYLFLQPKIQSIVKQMSASQESNDYSGTGRGSVTVTINQGDIGSDVAKTLQSRGVVKSWHVFYKLLLADQNIQFQPGSYKLHRHMSAQAAFTAIQDSKNKVTATIVVPEGAVLSDIEDSLVAKGGLSRASVKAAAADLSAYTSLPAGTTSLEGWLFPATYTINPSWTAKQYFSSMVYTMIQHLDDAGVPAADRAHVVVFASLVQKEAGLAADYPKVARVFQNRLDQNMKLQSDATVAYGSGHTDRVTTTDAERADTSNKYNTYVHAGLPPGPISNPGDIAIAAALHPAAGSWLYFVTVNLETGQTVFSNTYAEHQAAVQQFQTWLRAHPDYNK